MLAALRPLAIAAVVASIAGAQNKSTNNKAQTPTVSQALQLEPIQDGVAYDTPKGDALRGCTIKPRREGKSTAWIVIDSAGAVLRRFADTNADNVVDTWSYYQNGLEVYRDADTDYDGRADQYRWFHTGGSRWGIDDDQDTNIDRWRAISPQEVAEEAVAAVLAKDADRFERLVVSGDELKSLGVGKTLRDKIDKGRGQAVSEFKKLARGQKTITTKSRYVDFGAPRPGVIPSGVDGSTKDVTVYENASALIDNEGAPEQLLLGSLVRVDGGWRLIESPRFGEGAPDLANVFSVPSLSSQGSRAPAGAPSEQAQQWMGELEKLDKQSATASPKELARLTGQRVAVLEKLARSATDRQEAEQWYTQLADLLSSAAQSEGYEDAVKKLAELEESNKVTRLGRDLVAHFRFRRIGAEHGLAYRDPNADYAKLQELWTADLEKFVNDYPTSTDAAEAMLQLGSMAGEFSGKSKVAEQWYSRVSSEFPNTPSGRKGAGALRRLGSIGKRLDLKGEALRGGKIDLAAAPYRGKHVLVHYWATWSGPEADIALIERLKKQYRGKLEVIGINLDASPRDAQAFVTKQKVSWKNLYDDGGLEGRRAESMGVMTLPLMLLVDQRGAVVNRDLHSGEIAEELARVIR